MSVPHAVLQDLGINMSHIESRPSKQSPGQEYEFYVDCECVTEELMERLKSLAKSVSVLSRSPKKDEG